jgi:hypothetical protein
MGLRFIEWRPLIKKAGVGSHAREVPIYVGLMSTPLPVSFFLALPSYHGRCSPIFICIYILIIIHVEKAHFPLATLQPSMTGL